MRKQNLLAAAVLAGFAMVGGDALAKKPDNPGKPDKPGKPGKPDKSTFGKARGPLVRGAADDGKGRIDIQRRRNGSDLRIMGQRLDAGIAVDVVIKRLGDDPATTDVVETDFEESQTLADDVLTNDEGAVKVMLRTHKGDGLPFDAASLDDLAGARVCIRVAAVDDDGEDLLVGTIPLIGADYPKRSKERSDLVPVDDLVTCEGRIRLRFRGKDVRSELRIDVKGLVEGDAVSFRMDDGSGSLVEVGTATADADGEARYGVRTHHGDALPFDALTVLDLRGRDVEVWVTDGAIAAPLPTDAALCLTGVVPGAAPDEE